MDNFITLTCPTCGGKLQITDDIERFACGNCGNEHIVKRSGGIVSLAPVAESLKNIRVGVDKTASELAIQRLSHEIASMWANDVKIRKQLIGTVMVGGGYFYFFSDLREIIKARRKTFSNAKQEIIMEWFTSSETRISVKEIDWISESHRGYFRKHPIDGLSELRDLEINIEKKEEERKKHQAIVSG